MKLKITLTLEWDDDAMHGSLKHEPPLREMLESQEGKLMALSMDAAIAASQEVYEKFVGGPPTIATWEVHERQKKKRR